MSRLEAKGVTKRYGGVAALDDVSFHVDGGTILALLGPSGSGKSTLLRLLHLLEAPDSGAVLLDGSPGGAAERGNGAVRRFGLVQQRPGLLRGSSIDNVAFPLRARGVPKREALAAAASRLEGLGLGGKKPTLPHELSGGEAQRVALARALVTRPDFLLLDEGTNQLDPRRVRDVERILREEARRGCAIVVATHNLGQALRLADSFVLLEEGRVVDAGDRERLRDPRTDSLRVFAEFA